MLKNEYGILKNGNKIFRSNIVDSYLKTNTTGTIYISTHITGSTPNLPVYGYNKTSTRTIKCIYTSDPIYTISFPATNNDNQKLQYFCGNLEGVTYVRPYSSNAVGCFGGDLPQFANQFQNLCCLDMGYRETDFNQDISYSSFPETLQSFSLYDKGIQGDVGTISGLENVKSWKLCCTQALSGNFHDIKSTSIETLCVRNSLSNLKFDLNCLTDNNPNLNCTYLYSVAGAQMSADTMNMENLTYINWYLPYNDLHGDFTNWNFNTGLTYYCTSFRYVAGDLTNWNIPETNVTTFSVYNQGYSTTDVGGSLSGWTMPSTLTNFTLSYTNNITSIPNDYSNSPNLNIINMNSVTSLSGDVTTFILPVNITQLSFYKTQMCGNLEEFIFPTGLTSLQFRHSCFTGNLSGITLPLNINSLYLEGNFFNGNVSDLSIPLGVTTMNITNPYQNGMVYLDLNTSFDTKNMYNLYMNYMTGITGSFTNMTIGDSLSNLSMCYSNISADLNELDLNNIRMLNICSSNIYQDITPMFTGVTNLYQLYMSYNSNLSGDTTNWQIDNIGYLTTYDTALSGRLSHSNSYYLCIGNTNINSCLDTDLNFSNQAYYINMDNAQIQGNLSAVTFNYNCIQQFNIQNNSNVFGANDFVCNMFVNRKNFVRPTINFYWQNIGDNVSGVTEELGDLGTWSGSEWDLTEAQVNNLVAGIDYTGTGTNVPWDNKEKIYWMKNALKSGGVIKRYSYFNLSYS